MNGAPFSLNHYTPIEIYYLREKAVWYACRFLGQPIPYIYGGDDPLRGFDCSGFVHEILQSVGIEEPGYDCTAHQIYLNLRERLKSVEEAPYAGCLVFWFRDGRVYHVAVCIDKYHVVEASGGGKTTTNREEAVRRNAYIKMRPIGSRGTNYKIIDPFKLLRE